jgi:ABC-type uncharacterized transport system permease subunit
LVPGARVARLLELCPVSDRLLGARPAVAVRGPGPDASRPRHVLLYGLLLVPVAAALLSIAVVVLLAVVFDGLPGAVYGAFWVFVPLIAAATTLRLARQRRQRRVALVLLPIATLVLTSVFTLLAILVGFIVIGGVGGGTFG